MNQLLVAARAQMLLDDPQKHATLHRRWSGKMTLTTLARVKSGKSKTVMLIVW